MAAIVAKNYAEALYSLALDENKTDKFREELKFVCESLNLEKEFMEILLFPKISKSEKKTLIDKVFGELDILLVNFLKILIDKSRFSNILEINKEFDVMYREEHQIEVAYVSSAIALTDDEKQQIKNLLEKKTNKKVEMICKVDESLLAGVRIKLKDEVIDNSASNRLMRLKESVMNNVLK